MSAGDIAGASRPTRLLLFASFGIWSALAIALPLAALTLNAFRLGLFPLGFWVAAQGAIIGIVVLAAFYAWRAKGQSGGGNFRTGLVFAGEAAGAAVILGFTSTVATLGYDGLALPLGLVAGFGLLTLLVAPRFVLYPVRSISGFFAIRFGGSAVRRVGLVVLFFATAILIAADIKAGARAVQLLGNLSLDQAVGGLAVAIAFVWVLASYLSFKRLGGLGYGLVISGIAVTAGALSYAATGSPVPQIALGNGLKSYADLNQTLVIKHIADVQSLVPMTSPYLQLSMRNFSGLLLAVTLGIVAAPHLLGRHLAQAVTIPGSAVRRAAMATAAVSLIALTIAPLAVFSRLGFEQAMVKGVETAAIPQAFAEAGGLGLMKICGEATSDQAALSAACKKASGQRGFLRLQDVAFADDGFIVTAPKLSGLDPNLQYPLLLAAVLAALVAGKSLVLGLAAADAEIRQNVLPRPLPLDVRTFLVCASALALGAVVAEFWTIGAANLATDGFALIACGIMPALILGLHWRRMNARGAVAAMILGTAIAVIYLLGVHVWPVEFFRLTAYLSNAPAGAVQRFADLDAAWQSAGDPQSRALARAALEHHAARIANWGGLVPAAIVLVAVPIAIVVGGIVSLVSKSPTAEPAAN